MWSLVVLSVALGANPYLAQARSQYRQLDYERCVRTLNAALKAEVGPGEAAEIQLFQGLCQHGLGQLSEAENHVLLALRLDPDIRPPEDVSPAVTTFFENARKKLPAPVTPPKPAPVAETDAKPKDAPVQPKLTPSEEAVVVAPPVEQKSVRTYAVPIALSSAAVLATGTGIFFGLRAQADERAFKAEPLELPASRIAERARGSATAANVSYAVGGALAAGAAIAWTLLLR